MHRAAVPYMNEVVKDNQTDFNVRNSAALTFVYRSQAWAFSGESVLQLGLMMGLPCISSQQLASGRHYLSCKCKDWAFRTCAQCQQQRTALGWL